jgi:hypothetical protein
VRARRYDHDVHVRWSGVKGARGYIVEVANAQRGRPVGLVRRVSSRSRGTTFRSTPGGGRLLARVHALNSDDNLGRAGSDTFPTGPSARTLTGAARRSARSIRRAAGLVTVVTQCPEGGGHCQVVVELRRRGRLLGRSRFQQTPDTFHLHCIRPNSRHVQQLIREGRSAGIDVVVKMSYGAQGRSRAKATLRSGGRPSPQGRRRRG